jgi:hypothetical protein
VSQENPFRGVCAWCGKEVWARHIAREVICWNVERTGGGGNAVQGPDKRDTGRIMHTACHTEALLRERSGLIPGQTSLI